MLGEHVGEHLLDLTRASQSVEFCGDVVLFADSWAEEQNVFDLFF
ncbi:MAG: hypothetical protein WKF30_02455 [Pyrinomonadaceae bacterium]